MDSTRNFFENELKKKLIMKASGYTTEENVLIKAFKYFDLDNSGLCNEREFIQTIQKIGITGFSEENLSQLFKFYDKDNSGKISYNEFVGIIFNNKSILNEEKKIQSQKNNESNDKEDEIKNNEIEKEIQNENNNEINEIKNEEKIKEDDKKEEEEENEEEDPIILKIKEKLIKRGLRGIISLESNFRSMDHDNSQTIDYDQFCKLSNDFRFNLTNEESQQIFQMFDTEQNGRINYDEFVRQVRGEISEKRRKLVENVFEFLDKNNSGEIHITELNQMYNAKNHPDTLSGKKNEEETLQEFLDTFQGNHSYLNGDDDQEGIVTIDEFIDYYESVSSLIKKYKDFEKLLTYVWGLKSDDDIRREENEEKKNIINENKGKIRRDDSYKNQDEISNRNYNKNDEFDDNNLQNENEDKYDDNYKQKEEEKYENQKNENEDIYNDNYQQNEEGEYENQQNENEDKYMREEEEVQKEEKVIEEEKSNQKPINQIESESLLKFRTFIRKKGIKSMLDLLQQFKICDGSGNHNLQKPEFTKALKQANLNLSESEIEELFKEFDINNSNSINYDEFMNIIIPDLNERRKNVIIAAFNKIDLDKSGIIELNELKSFFNTRNNPEVSLGKKSEEDVYTDFIQTFRTHHNITSGIRDKRVTLEEFIKYYKFISASIQNDDLFVGIVVSHWKLNNYKDYYQNVLKDNIQELENEDYFQDKKEGKFKKPYKKSVPYGIDNEPINYSTSNRPEGRRSEKLSKYESPFTIFKNKIKNRGSRGIMSLRRTFMIYDDNNSDIITFQQFQKYIYDFRIPITDDQIKGVFNLFDKEKKGEINYVNLIGAITGQMSDFRKNLIQKVFEKLDVDNKGFINVEDIRSSYNPKRHPDVLNGKKTEPEILSEFIDILDYHFNLLNQKRNPNDKRVTLNDFIDFYTYISALYDDDEYFEAVIIRSWGLSGYLNFAKGYKGTNKRDFNAENNY